MLTHNFHLFGMVAFYALRKSYQLSLLIASRFIEERHNILGFDLAAAHFIIARGGRVRLQVRLLPVFSPAGLSQCHVGMICIYNFWSGHACLFAARTASFYF